MRLARQIAMKRRGHRGFTLIELMVVMTILALAAVLVLPEMARGFADARLRLEARSIANLFLQGRERAVFKARSFLVIFGPPDRGRRTLYLAAEDGKVIDKVAFPTGVVLRAQVGEDQWTEDPPPVHFFPNGTCQPLQLDLQGNNGSHVQLQLDPLTARMHVAQIYKGN